MAVLKIPVGGGGRVYSSIRTLNKTVGYSQAILFDELTPTTLSVRAGDTIIDRLYSIGVVTADVSEGDSFPVKTVQAGEFEPAPGFVMATYAEKALQDQAGNDIQATYAKKTELGAVFTVSATGCLTNAVVTSFVVGDLLVISFEGIVDANSSTQPILTWMGSDRQHILSVGTYNGIWVSNAVNSNIPITCNINSGGQTITTQNLWSYRGYRIGGVLAIPLMSTAAALTATEEQLNALGTEERMVALNYISKVKAGMMKKKLR